MIHLVRETEQRFLRERKAFEYNIDSVHASTVGLLGIPKLNTHRVRKYGADYSKSLFTGFCLRFSIRSDFRDCFGFNDTHASSQCMGASCR